MKFTYDKKTNDRECVAYIDGDGCLCLNDKIGNASLICLASHGAATFECLKFDPSKATHKFYPGDKLTIEF